MTRDTQPTAQSDASHLEMITTPQTNGWTRADRLLRRAEARHEQYWRVRARQPRGPRTERAWRRWASGHWQAMAAYQEVAR